MAPFTCITCSVAFSDADIQRSHYKTDWHRYNLKRKVIQLPPITAEDFQSRVCQQRAKELELSKDEGVFCKICRKSFATKKAFDNHILSKKHRIALDDLEATSETMLNDFDVIGAVKNIPKKEVIDRRCQLPLLKEVTMDVDDEDSDWEDESGSECDDEFDQDNFDEITQSNPILKHNCLFCSHHSRSLSRNLKHMYAEHTFFVPDLDYVCDIQGLLLYLGEKVCKFNMCLWCNLKGKGFYSMDAAQSHMRDKGHCKMLHEGESLLEYMPYYDYSKSYPDDEDDINLDDEIPPIEDIDTGDYQLTLPSGATIGHRSLFVYYK